MGLGIEYQIGRRKLRMRKMGILTGGMLGKRDILWITKKLDFEVVNRLL